MNFYCYDLETTVNTFLFTGKFIDHPEIQTFEISPRKNQRNELLSWLSYLQNARVQMVGYNNLGFDYPIIHNLMNNPYTFDALTAFNLAQTIIQSQGYGFERIRQQDRLIPQVDVMKINHFDNMARRTSLKSLQFAMRSESVEDMPFDFRTDLTSEQIDLMISYNRHDVTETEKFFNLCKHHVMLRKELLDNGVLSGDVMNWSDVKIGTEYLVKKIGRSKCYLQGSTPRQSKRQSVNFAHIIHPKVKFRNQEFEAVNEWFKKQTIYINSSDRPKLQASLGGLSFHFGVGGVHASVENKTYHSRPGYRILDIDVSGMYVAVAIANGFSPEHLGQDFVTAYKQLQSDRGQYPKGSTMNLVLKLAGNGVFGNSNNDYSPFYDPKYTFSVTVNGQLELMMLVELLSMLPGLELIQANTDGITAYVPDDVIPFFDLWCREWEQQTGLKLEQVEYKSMFIRDVNNYVAVDTKGNVKLKGAYWYPKKPEDFWGGSGSNWNKDFSMLVVQKCVEQYFVNGHRPEDIIKLIADPFDFMIRYKSQGGAKVYIGDKLMSKTVRYYVSTAGEPMRKIADPKGPIGAYKRKNKLTDDFFLKILSEIPKDSWDARIHTGNKSKYAAVVTSIESGRKVKCCNKASDFNWADLDYDYYLEEIKKLMLL